jgi:hypothetical protein
MIGCKAAPIAIKRPQGILDLFASLVGRSHCFGPSRPHEMFDALGRADKYRKGRKTKKRSPKFHMIGEQSPNENKISHHWGEGAPIVIEVMNCELSRRPAVSCVVLLGASFDCM